MKCCSTLRHDMYVNVRTIKGYDSFQKAKDKKRNYSCEDANLKKKTFENMFLSWINHDCRYFHKYYSWKSICIMYVRLDKVVKNKYERIGHYKYHGLVPSEVSPSLYFVKNLKEF